MKNKFLKISVKVLISNLISLGVLVLVALPIRIIFYSDAEGEVNALPLLLCCQIIFTLVFFFRHTRKQEDYMDIIIKDEKFSFWENLKRYFKQEGKFVCIVFTVLILIDELSCLFLGSTNRNVIAFFLVTMFPFEVLIPIPVVRSVLSWGVTMLFYVVVTTIYHYRTYQYWNKNKAPK